MASPSHCPSCDRRRTTDRAACCQPAVVSCLLATALCSGRFGSLRGRSHRGDHGSPRLWPALHSVGGLDWEPHDRRGACRRRGLPGHAFRRKQLRVEFWLPHQRPQLLISALTFCSTGQPLFFVEPGRSVTWLGRPGPSPWLGSRSTRRSSGSWLTATSLSRLGAQLSSSSQPSLPSGCMSCIGNSKRRSRTWAMQTHV